MLRLVWGEEWERVVVSGWSSGSSGARNTTGWDSGSRKWKEGTVTNGKSGEEVIGKGTVRRRCSKGRGSVGEGCGRQGEITAWEGEGGERGACGGCGKGGCNGESGTKNCVVEEMAWEIGTRTLFSRRGCILFRCWWGRCSDGRCSGVGCSGRGNCSRRGVYQGLAEGVQQQFTRCFS